MRFLSTLSILLILGLAGCRQEPPVPSFIEDPAGLLEPAEAASLADFHRHLLRDVDVHLKVAILPQASPDIDGAAVEMFDRYALGSTTRGARGVLLLVDPQGEKVRLEIGYDLEPLLTDAFVGYVEREQMVPFFREGLVGQGLEATAELLVDRLLREESSGRASGAKTRLDHLSGGGGAKVPVEIGSGRAPAAKIDTARYRPQHSPMQTLRLYLEVLRRHVQEPQLPLYTPQTRELLDQRVMTAAQQDHERKVLEEALDRAEIVQDGERAVVRFPVAQRRLSPYFLRRSEAGWMLDFAAASRLVGFNHKNQWFFRDRQHPYMFAFRDLRFDRHGFPHEPARR